MASLFKRLKDTISADLHNIIDEKEEKNPIAKLNQYIRESEKETEKVHKLIERQYRLKEEYNREYHQAQDMADKRKRQAEIAQKAGEESMVEFANKEFEEYDRRAGRMKDMRNEMEEQLHMLEQKYEDMKHRLKDMHVKRMELMGRENVARAQYRMNRVMDQDVDKPYSRFQEMDQYIQDLEQKVNRNYQRSTFDSKMAQIERELKEQEKVSAK
ncbi:PspA/IM30 family protein [Salinibacillus xinjiangensis]|uniref:PspA/IM30 family protein n=1 Tax=Salinibacillus xinjiangensis TaxID=1229268 RepID=A0A6G1X8T3_9BACI|nr:PspA/IM30 family protein [Salinibacillus xinjiangensis]MRG87316.1 PspA/IM30 family protein [Salinibacillus xinjiangensis]